MIGPRKFQLVSVDAPGGGTRDESLRVSALEANDIPGKDVFGKCYFHFG